MSIPGPRLGSKSPKRQNTYHLRLAAAEEAAKAQLAAKARPAVPAPGAASLAASRSGAFFAAAAPERAASPAAELPRVPRRPLSARVGAGTRSQLLESGSAAMSGDFAASAGIPSSVQRPSVCSSSSSASYDAFAASAPIPQLLRRASDSDVFASVPPRRPVSCSRDASTVFSEPSAADSSGRSDARRRSSGAENSPVVPERRPLAIAVSRPPSAASALAAFRPRHQSWSGDSSCIPPALVPRDADAPDSAARRPPVVPYWAKVVRPRPLAPIVVPALPPLGVGDVPPRRPMSSRVRPRFAATFVESPACDGSGSVVAHEMADASSDVEL
jgi:hypothetical protein